MRDVRLEGGIILDKMTLNIGIVPIGKGSGATFVSDALKYYLKESGKTVRFMGTDEKYHIMDEPLNPEEMDLLVAVIDPRPSQIIKGIETFRMLREPGWNVIWLQNRNNPGINRKELRRFLELRPQFYQDDIPFEELTKAEFSCSKIYDMRELTGIRELAEHIKKTM